MSILNICGFETGDTSEIGNGVSGTTSIQTSTVRSGTYALRCNPTTTGTGQARFVTMDAAGAATPLTGGTDRYLRFWFNYATKPSSNQEPICRITQGSAEGTGHLDIVIDSSGKLSAYQSNVAASSRLLIATGTTVLSSGTWYRIEVKRIAGTSGVAWELKINGTSEISGTFSPAATTGTEIALGKNNNWNGNSVDFFYDDLSLSDSAYPGDGKGLLLTPSANGNYQTWSIGAGSGSHFQVVDDIPNNSDTDYLLSTGTSTNAETEGLTDTATAGISGTIYAAKSLAILKRDGASNGSVKLRTRSGSTDSDAGSAFGSTSAYTLGARIHATDPATSSAWTTGGLDGAEVGTVEQTTNKTRMTMVGLYVDFVPAAGATSYTFTGPSSGTVNVASTNFTVTPVGGTSTATVTPATSGSGSFTPSSVTFSGSGAQTFTYTPTSTSGSPHTLSVTNNGGLTDPGNLSYTVNAAATAQTRMMMGM